MHRRTERDIVWPLWKRASVEYSQSVGQQSVSLIVFQNGEETARGKEGKYINPMDQSEYESESISTPQLVDSDVSRCRIREANKAQGRW